MGGKKQNVCVLPRKIQKREEKLIESRQREGREFLKRSPEVGKRVQGLERRATQCSQKQVLEPILASEKRVYEKYKAHVRISRQDCPIRDLLLGPLHQRLAVMAGTMAAGTHTQMSTSATTLVRGICILASLFEARSGWASSCRMQVQTAREDMKTMGHF